MRRWVSKYGMPTARSTMITATTMDTQNKVMMHASRLCRHGPGPVSPVTTHSPGRAALTGPPRDLVSTPGKHSRGSSAMPVMSVFTDKERDYLAGQRLGRIATVGPDGQPHVVPTSFRYNPEQDTIDVGGLRMSQTKKLRDVQRTGRASIVVDDVLPPWQPRMIEIRGTAAVVPEGGKALNERFEDTIVRIRPTRIISFGIDPGEAPNARPAGR